jgi:hypothetical protein
MKEVIRFLLWGVLVLTILVFGAIAACAQSSPRRTGAVSPQTAIDTPRFELAFYSSISGLPVSGQKSPFVGLNVSFSGNLNDWAGVVGEVGEVGNGSARQVTYQAGPRFSYRKLAHTVPFAHFLAGAGTLKAPTAAGVSHTSSSVVATAGVGLDVIEGSLVLRLPQFDYQVSRFGGHTRGTTRLSGGFVFYFGHK